MSKEKQRQLDEINRPMNEELYNNIEKQYKKIAKVRTESEQIEEMALIICGFKDCTDCISRMGLRKCGAKAYAERFYNAGYRKQSEGEWLVVSDYADSRIVECSNCEKQFYFQKKGQLNIDRMPYCPNCGAKMKGGAE